MDTVETGISQEEGVKKPRLLEKSRKIEADFAWKYVTTKISS